MPERDGDELARLTRRYERERAARLEAESIAERVTGQLYGAGLQLEHLNGELLRTNDELQLLNASLRDFVAVASHDLRAPLTTIVGWASLLTERWDEIAEDERRAAMPMIDRQARHLARLVDDLLTVSRIEAGALDTHADVVSLRNAIERVTEDFTAHAEAIRVSLPAECAELAVVADPDHLQRILVNYVGNAIKYGAPPVEVEVRVDGPWVEIRVRDAGDGVPEDFVPRLFGRFARADTPATREQKGTGLGLSIVQGLARANGGETWYEPNEPRGSCFALRLPTA